MLKPTHKILLDALSAGGFLSPEVLAKVTPEAESQDDLKAYLLQARLVTEDQILAALSKFLHLPVVDVRSVAVDKGTLEKIPVRFAWYYKFMPLKREGKFLTLAVSMPLEVRAQDEIRVLLGVEPQVVLAKESDILESLKKYYGLAAETIDRILTRDPARKVYTESSQEKHVEDLEKQSEDTSVINLVNQIILEAYQKRATDIHIEPYRDKVRFRYRVDGILVDANLPAEIRLFMQAILSRIKIMANLSIVERRLPQDGSAVVKTKEQTIDLRISTIPTAHGESMVIRILPARVMEFSLKKLGLSPENVKILERLIRKPHGIIFVTGPTGSGKTTTLYACLKEISDPQTKIITIEDPIEYEMEGVTQIQVNPKVQLDFAAGLRSVLRHDPDVIMVGEVRDLETAEIAIRTALTGHLVLSSLHTNDAASGVTRLLEMGLEPYLVASSIEAFIAQRLVRLICSSCKTQDSDDYRELKTEIAGSLKISDPQHMVFYRGAGCSKCNQTGYLGRTTIHELLTMNDVIRTAILERPRADYIRKLAVSQGMLTLRQDGWQKVLAGLTTPLEVLNATATDEIFQGATEAPELRSFPADSLRFPAAFQDRYRVIPKKVLDQKNEYDSRAYPRLEEKLNIRYHVLHGEIEDPQTLTVKGVEHSTYTKDISAGGVAFLSGHAVAVGAILELKISLPGQDKSVDCLARVCRREDNVFANLFLIVGYYLDLESSDRARLEHFVKEKLS